MSIPSTVLHIRLHPPTILWLQSPHQVLTLSCPCSPINSATQRFPYKQPREIKVFDSFNLVVQAVNDAPALSDLPTDGRIEIPESSTYLYDFNATDEDGDNLSFSISGTDASYLEINSTSGTLRFQEEPDFENPWDADHNNTYEIEILVSDSVASSQTFSLMIIVSDLDENAWTTVEESWKPLEIRLLVWHLLRYLR